VPFAVPSGQTCRGAGGVPGLIAGGSGDIPNGRFTGVPLYGSAQSNPGLDAALLAAGLSGMGSRGFTFNDEGTTVRPAVTPQDDFNLGPDNYLQVPQERIMLNSFSHFDINEHATAYLEFHFSNNKVDQQLAPTNINGNFLFDVDNPYLSTEMQEVLNQLDLRETGTTTVTTGTATRTTTPGDGLAILSVGRRLREVPLRYNISERNVYRAAFGLRGDIGSLSESFFRNLAYDAYYSYAKTEETSRQAGNVSRSRFAAGVLSSGGADPVVNPFGQNISPAGVSAIQISATNVQEAELQVAAATLTGELFDMPAGVVDFSLGVEWRYAAALFVPDEFLRSGDVVGFNPGLPTGGDVTAREIYGEVRVPLLSNLPLVQNLTANGAFRFSDYDLDGVGGVWTYLYGADWEVTDDLTFRGQFQRAIRAPNVGDLYGGLRRSVDPATDPCSSRQPSAQQTQAVRDVCEATGVPSAAVFTAGVQSNNIIEGYFGGNPSVGEESSDTYTVGAVFRPSFLPGFGMSIDYFDITLEGAIAPLGGGLNNTLNLCYNVIQDENSEFCQSITRNPITGEISGGPYNVQVVQANTGALETSGVDFEAHYTRALDFGLYEGSSDIDVSSSWTWTEEYTSTPVQAFPNIQNECVGAYGTTCGEPIPELKGVTRVTWSTGPLSLSVRHRFLDEVTVDRFLLPTRSGGAAPNYEDLVNPTLDAQHYFDVSGSFDITETFQLYAGVRNLTDQDPPVVGSAQVRANTWPATYDYNGREFFIGGTVKIN
jgi:iron complex outermembrane receptor protein